MGLPDVLNGMRNGPRGQRDPATAGGGMSPVTMAVLGLLAYKALKNFGGNRPSPAGSGPSGARCGTHQCAHGANRHVER